VDVAVAHGLLSLRRKTQNLGAARLGEVHLGAVQEESVACMRCMKVGVVVPCRYLDYLVGMGTGMVVLDGADLKVRETEIEKEMVSAQPRDASTFGYLSCLLFSCLLFSVSSLQLLA